MKFTDPAALVGYVLYYAIGTAISDERMLWDQDGEVGFKVRPRRSTKRSEDKTKPDANSMSLPKQEFLDRFVSHFLPLRFRRVRMYGLYANNERDRLAIAKQLLQPAGELTSPDNSHAASGASDSIEQEFEGTREGQTTYRVRCQKCADEPPMQTEFRLSGSQTMRVLSFIVLMQTYLKGELASPPSNRPSGLPYFFARVATELSPPRTPGAQPADLAFHRSIEARAP